MKKKLVLINPHPKGRHGEEDIRVIVQMPLNLAYIAAHTPLAAEDAHQAGNDRFAQHTSVEGLWLAGQWTSPGPGVCAVGAGGGVGATTLAVQSACLLASQLKQGVPGVCLLDLDIQFGASLTHGVAFSLAIGRKAVDGDHHRHAVLAHVLDMAGEIGDARLHRGVGGGFR